MEFHINTAGKPANIVAIESALRAVDPAALVDLDAATGRLRIAAAIGAVELGTLLNQAGVTAAADQVVQLPSVCCGGCSG